MSPMKHLLYLIILIVNIQFLYGQLPDPITKSTTTFGVKVSDFGPRHYSASKFHYGIDYRCRLGKKAYTVDGGQILSFGSWGTWISYIRVLSDDDSERRYLHVESGTYLDGNIPLWEYIPDYLGINGTMDNFIFLRYIDNSTFELNTSAILATNGYSGNVTQTIDVRTGDLVTISTSVNQSSWIFMPRDLTIGAHLHIDHNNEVNINPLSTIAYNNTGDPTLLYSKIKRKVNNQAKEFEPNNIVYGSPIILEAKVNTTVDMDLDVFSIKCQNDNLPIEFNDEWRLTNRGTKLANVSKANVILTNPMNNETWIQNNVNKGVYPYDPNNSDDADPGHDYFKLHWPSSKSTVTGQPMAYVNQRAEYSDGDYSINFEATDISNNKTPPVVKVVTLDNHIPYVCQVKINSGNTIYSSVINYIDPSVPDENHRGMLKREDSDINANYADFQNDLVFYITTSESMSTVSLELKKNDINGVTVFSGDLDALYNNPSVWRIIIPKQNLPSIFAFDETYQLRISGTDFSDNEIIFLGLATDESTAPLHLYPFRGENGDWNYTNYATDDRDHKFSFQSLDMLKAIFTLILPDKNNKSNRSDDAVYGYSPLTVDFEDASTGTPQNWTWDYGDNSLPVTKQNPQHTFVNESDEPIQYNVSLKVCNENGCDVTLKNKLITVYPEGYTDIPIADFAFTQESYFQPFVVQFQNYSVGNINNFKWYFGDANTNNSDFEPVHEYSRPGTYHVKLVLNEGDELLNVVYQTTIEVLEGSENFAPVDFEWTCLENIDNLHNAEGLNGELIDFKTKDSFYSSRYEWDMGDGTIYYLSSPSHSYINTGTYPVTLTIKTFDGDLIGQKTKLVNVVPSRLVVPQADNEISTHDNKKVCDFELQGDELFVTFDFNSNLFIYEYNYGNNTWAISQEPLYISDHDFPFYYNISVSGDLLLVAWTGIDHIEEGTYFFKKINGVWVKQNQVLTDPDDNYWNFGLRMDLFNNWAVIESYSKDESIRKLTFWKYNTINNIWEITDNTFYSSFGGSLNLKRNVASWGCQFFTLNADESWSIVNTTTCSTNEFYPKKTGQVNNSHILLFHQNTVRTFIREDDDSFFLKLPVLSITNGGNLAFGSSISEYENYLLTGNSGYGFPYPTTAGSAVLFRRKSNGNYNFSNFRTYIPSNGVVGDNFGYGVKINKNHIVINSNGVDTDEIYKSPGLYYYYNYAYFGDRELNIPSIQKYRTLNNDPLRFEARNIEIGGSAKSSVSVGDDLDLIGQKVILSSGFSATNGAVFKATGTFCSDYYERSTIKDSKSETFKETTFLDEFVNYDQGEQNMFIIRPNPGTSEVNIYSSNNTTTIDKVELYELNGRQILIKEIKNRISLVPIDISSVPRGVYVFVVYSEEKRETLKFVKL